MKDKENNVEKVANEYLCSTCGGCSFVCPEGAIKYKETAAGYVLPEIDKELCTDCGLCLSVCPGTHFGETLKNKLPKDPFVGKIKSCYSGKATDEEIYNNSQSGGITTALLVNALEQRIIQAVIVTTLEKGNPPQVKAKLAKSRKDLVRAQKSKYCVAPLLEILREIEVKELNFGIVGLGCHIHGLINILDNKPKLKKKVKFKIGLFCDRNMTRAGIDFLIKQSKFKKKQSMLHFRDKKVKGYPGHIKIFDGKGNVSTKPASVRMTIKDFFTPIRCRLCFDKLNIFSDIAVGDPWGIEEADHETGESVVICRSKKGKKLLLNAVKKKHIMLKEVECDKIIKGQRINKKRKQWYGYCKAWKEMGFTLPNYYNQVKESAGYSKNDKFKKDLAKLMSYASFKSRNEFLKAIKQRVFIKKLKKLLKLPIKLISKI
jgi:coenzyme F420 hydrogenase subunit beta